MCNILDILKARNRNSTFLDSKFLMLSSIKRCQSLHTHTTGIYKDFLTKSEGDSSFCPL